MIEDTTKASSHSAPLPSQPPPRGGVRCPNCGRGDWILTQTRAKMPRARCKGCDKAWAPWPDWKGAPGFGITDPAKVDTVRRLLAMGYEEVRLLATASDVSQWVARKLRRKWRANRSSSGR